MIAQASPEISFLLPTAPECSDHRYVAPHQPSKSELYKPQMCQNCAYETKVHRTLKEVTAEGHFLSFCLAAPVTLCYAMSSSVMCCTPEDAALLTPECHRLPYRLQKRGK